MKQRLDELERLHETVSAALKARSTALADTQRLVAKYEYLLHSTNKALNDIRAKSLMKCKNIDVDHMARIADHRTQLQVFNDNTTTQ